MGDMAKKKKTERARPEHDSDFDGPWKAAAREDFPLIVLKYFPKFHQRIDWTVEPVFEDTELTQIIGKPNKRNKFVDVLVKVRFIDGGDQLIWLHFEFQTSFDTSFNERTFYHNCGLVYLRKGPVITLVVRGDSAIKWEPSTFVYECEDFRHQINFPTCKLSEKLEKEWQNDSSLPVIVARAHLEAVKTASDPEARFAAKRDLVGELYRCGYTVAEFRRIFRLVDWMMHLREDLEERFVQFLNQTEKDMAGTFLSCIEREAHAEGEKEGLKKGEKKGEKKGLQDRAKLVLRQIETRCGAPVPKSSQKKIMALSSAQLDDLGIAVLGFEDLQDLETWLAS